MSGTMVVAHRAGIQVREGAKNLFLMTVPLIRGGGGKGPAITEKLFDPFFPTKIKLGGGGG